MEFLLLWSGEILGMRKTRIPSEPCMGLLHRIDEAGVPVAPSRTAINGALPTRLRPAFERAHLSEARLDQPKMGQRQPPLFYDLWSANHKPITRLYLQPLDALFELDGSRLSPTAAYARGGGAGS